MITRFSFDLKDSRPFLTFARSFWRCRRMAPKSCTSRAVACTVRSTSDLEARPIPGSDITPPVIGMFDPALSPDGSAVAFVAGSSSTSSRTGFEVTIERIAVAGGSPVSICPSEGLVTGLDWGADGVVFADSSGKIQRVSQSGGKPELLVKVDDNEIPAHPQMLPGGLSVVQRRQKGRTRAGALEQRPDRRALTEVGPADDDLRGRK